MSAIEQAIMLNEQLKSTNRFCVKMIVVLSMVLLVSVSMNFVQWKYQPEPELLGITADHRVLPLPFLDDPYHQPSTVLGWAEKRIEEMYTFGFTDIKDLPTRLSSYMTGPVITSHINGIKSSGVWAKVVDERRVGVALRKGNPRILGEDVMNGRYMWQIEMPIEMVLEGAKDRLRIKRVVRVVVGREDLSKTPDGLIIGKVTSYE